MPGQPPHPGLAPSPCCAHRPRSPAASRCRQSMDHHAEICKAQAQAPMWQTHCPGNQQQHGDGCDEHHVCGRWRSWGSPGPLLQVAPTRAPGDGQMGPLLKCQHGLVHSPPSPTLPKPGRQQHPHYHIDASTTGFDAKAGEGASRRAGPTICAAHLPHWASPYTEGLPGKLEPPSLQPQCTDNSNPQPRSARSTPHQVHPRWSRFPRTTLQLGPLQVGGGRLVAGVGAPSCVVARACMDLCSRCGCGSLSLRSHHECGVPSCVAGVGPRSV